MFIISLGTVSLLSPLPGGQGRRVFAVHAWSRCQAPAQREPDHAVVRLQPLTVPCMTTAPFPEVSPWVTTGAGKTIPMCLTHSVMAYRGRVETF